MKWPARGFDLAWIAIEKSFVLSSHSCSLDCPWKADCHCGSKQAESNAHGLPLKSHLFCPRPQSSKEPLLHTAMTLNNHHFVSTSPFSRSLILPSDFPPAQKRSAEQTLSFGRRRMGRNKTSGQKFWVADHDWHHSTSSAFQKYSISHLWKCFKLP